MRYLKHKKLLVLGTLACLCLALLWLQAPQPFVRVTFLYSTNDTRIGVFRLENDLTEPVHAIQGVFERKSRHGWVLDTDAGAVEVGGGDLRVGTAATRVFQIFVPTNAGPYRLVLFCCPESKVGAAYVPGPRRSLGRLMPLLGVPIRWQGRVAGWYFPASQSFRKAPPIEQGQL